MDKKYNFSLLSFRMLYLVWAIMLETRQHNQKSDNHGFVRKLMSRKLRIPTLIISTSIVFNVPSNAFFYLAENRGCFESVSCVNIALILLPLRLISDVIIYVLPQKRIREYTKVMLTRYFSSIY